MTSVLKFNEARPLIQKDAPATKENPRGITKKFIGNVFAPDQNDENPSQKTNRRTRYCIYLKLPSCERGSASVQPRDRHSLPPLLRI